MGAEPTPQLRWLVPGLAAAVLLVLLLGLDRDPPADETPPTTLAAEVPRTTTAPPAESPPTTAFLVTTTSPSESARSRPPIEAVPDVHDPERTDPGHSVPGLAGRLIVVTGQAGRSQEMRIIPIVTTDTPVQTVIPFDAHSYSIDAGETMLALVNRGELVVVPLDGSEQQVIASNVIEFAWSGDEPGRIAWLRTDQPGVELLETGVVTGGSLIGSTPLAGVEEGRRLFGLNSAGYWLSDRVGNNSFVTLTESGALEILRHPGDLAIVAERRARALIADLDVGGWVWTFGLVDEGRVRPLPWAPPDAGGEYGMAAFGHRFPSTIAFIGLDEGARSWLEVWGASGVLIARVEFPYRVWDVSWSPDNRYVVMPGSDNAGTHVVLVYDLVDSSLNGFLFDDWVQFAAVVN